MEASKVNDLTKTIPCVGRSGGQALSVSGVAQ